MKKTFVKCKLCDKEAITTAVHIPVCKEHDDEYQEEGRKYLPDHSRPFLQRLIEGIVS
jgi:hypothetical protein